MSARHDDTIEVERYELSSPPPYLFELERRDVPGHLRRAGEWPARGRHAGPRPGVGPRAAQRSAPTDVMAWVHIDEDGRVTGYTGKIEIGQNIRTSLAQAIADELHVPLDRVSLVMADTDLVPFDQGTFGSLTTPRMAPRARAGGRDGARDADRSRGRAPRRAAAPR